MENDIDEKILTLAKIAVNNRNAIIAEWGEDDFNDCLLSVAIYELNLGIDKTESESWVVEARSDENEE